MLFTNPEFQKCTGMHVVVIVNGSFSAPYYLYSFISPLQASVSGTISEAANAQLDATIASVMRVFVDALVDIPEHRRLSLFHKLLTTLDPQQHLWLFLCLVMESHTMHHSENTSDNKKTQEVDSRAPKRIEVALQIVSKFPPDTVLLNCIRIIKYLLLLPMEKGV